MGVRHSLFDRVNSMLHDQVFQKGDRRVLNETDLAVHIDRTGGIDDTVVLIRIFSVLGEHMPDKKLVVLDKEGRLVEVSTRFDDRRYGMTTYTAYNVPAYTSVQIQFMDLSDPEQSDENNEEELAVL